MSFKILVLLLFYIRIIFLNLLGKLDYSSPCIYNINKPLMPLILINGNGNQYDYLLDLPHINKHFYAHPVYIFSTNLYFDGITGKQYANVFSDHPIDNSFGYFSIKKNIFANMDLSEYINYVSDTHNKKVILISKGNRENNTYIDNRSVKLIININSNLQHDNAPIMNIKSYDLDLNVWQIIGDYISKYNI